MFHKYLDVDLILSSLDTLQKSLLVTQNQRHLYVLVFEQLIEKFPNQVYNQ